MKPLLAVLTGLVVLLWAAPASAHVSVSSPGATARADAVLTFRVPTESDIASTVKVAVQLPPFASVAVLPTPGWQVHTHRTALAKPMVTDDGDKVTEAITEVDWTASGAASAIKPGQFQEFSLDVGPLPDADTVGFGTVQTYSDGTVVRWNEVSAPGSSAEPDHPKPTLTLAKADPVAAAKPASTAGPIALSIVALVLAAAALGVAVIGNARRKDAGTS
jgi:uncharacterized protein